MKRALRLLWPLVLLTSVPAWAAREEFDLPLQFDGMVPLLKGLDLRARTYS